MLGSFLWRGTKATKTLVLTAALIGSLALNVATVVFDSLFQTISSAVEVAGAVLPHTWAPQTIRQRQAEKRSARISKTRIISKRLKRRATRAGLRTLAMHAAEAIPVAGVAMVVVDATLDLRDACKSMKDIDELEQVFGIVDDTDVKEDKVCGQTPPTRENIWQLVTDAPGKPWNAATKAIDEWSSYDEADAVLIKLPSWDDISTESKDLYAHSKNWLFSLFN